MSDMQGKTFIDLGKVDIAEIERRIKVERDYIDRILSEVRKIYIDVFQDVVPSRPEAYMWILPVPVLECIRRNKEYFDEQLVIPNKPVLMGAPCIASPQFSHIRCVLKCCISCIFCVDFKNGQHCGKRKVLAPMPCTVQLNEGGECFPPFKNWSPKQDLF